jgi:undecaprenyl diphosphate synthase
MKLFHKQLVESLTDFRDDDVVVRFIGDKSGFSDNLQKLIAETEEVSKDRNGMVLNIAMNYGGRDEILRAAKLLCEDCMSGKISADDITKEMFAQKLYTANQPDPDLIIRPGGEARISNFLLYQAAYSELYITDTLWPDFSEDDLIRAIDYYSKRNRRFGGI